MWAPVKSFRGNGACQVTQSRHRAISTTWRWRIQIIIWGGLICRDNKGGPADPEAVELVRAAQTAFLDGYMKQDAAALDWLRATDWQALSNGRATFETK